MKIPLIALLFCVPLLMAGSTQNSFVYPPSAHPFGQSQEQWSANWWTWFMEHPIANHPNTEGSDIAASQSGNVWFLNAVFEGSWAGPSERSITVPKGTTLFVPLVNGEWSSLEGFATEQEQRDAAVDQANHIVPSSLFCTLDGNAVINPSDDRFESPQFAFNAPTPWIFGSEGGAAMAVADGYFVFLKKLAKGHHTLHFGGQFHYSIAEGDPFDADFGVDFTYHINQL